MSFGFGDSVALVKLVKDVKTSLDQIRNASSDYQGLCRELENLQRALKHVDRIDTKTTDQSLLFGIKATALSCRWPLEEFLKKIERYETGLGQRGVRGSLAVLRKAAQWTSLSDEVTKLQNHLNLQVGTVNMMLTTHGLGTLHEIQDQSAVQQTVLQEISNGIQGHAAELSENKTLISQLYGVVVDTIVPCLENLVDIAERISRSNLDMYTLVFKMQSSVALCVSPTTWFQEPVLFEDACQRRVQLSSQFQYDEVLAIIKVRYPRGQCHQAILSGQFELHNVTNNMQISKEDWVGFLPGAHIKMAAVVDVDDIESCPNSNCDSKSFKADRNGSRTCVECCTWIGRPKKAPPSCAPPRLCTPWSLDSFSDGDGYRDVSTFDNSSTFKNILVHFGTSDCSERLDEEPKMSRETIRMRLSLGDKLSHKVSHDMRVISQDAREYCTRILNELYWQADYLNYVFKEAKR